MARPARRSDSGQSSRPVWISMKTSSSVATDSRSASSSSPSV